MSDFCLTPGFMIHAGFNVLDQGPCTPYVERLQPVANPQDGLVQVVSILEKQLVRGIAQWISKRRLRMPLPAVFLWINVCLAARQQNRGARGNTTRNFLLRQGQRNDYGFTTTCLYRADVWRQSPVTVLGIVRTKLGDGDLRFHSTSFRFRALGCQN